jgi:signal transduction histidine kinase
MTELLRRESLARLGEMAAVVAHEVRNPIAGIDGALSVIERRLPADGPERGVIAAIKSRLGALGRTVHDILLYARPREPELRAVPIRLLLEDTVSLLGKDPELADVRVTLTGEERHVLGDAELLKPVFLNLLQNAAQAMEGRGRIAVRVEGDGCACRVELADGGPGIPEALRERIFEPFFTTKHRGTGLGLPHARRVIEQHGGAIAFRCPGGGGTVFTVTLPLAGDAAPRGVS